MREDTGAAASLTSLPQGSGVSPLGDRFEPDLVRGSGSYAVPLSLPKGPNELQPSLGFSYSTGSGNGPFGLGWRLTLLRIERRTDRGVPSYDDDADTFVIGDGEELVAVGGGRYRPRTDTQFWSIVKDANGWTVRTGDGVTLLFGQAAASRESDGGRIFSWMLDEQRDAAGNAILFRYLRDGGRLYLEEAAWSVFSARFLYKPRRDVLRNGRAGFLRTTALRAESLDVSSQRAVPSVLRSYSFTYAAARNGLSHLVGISLSSTVGAATASLPDLSLDYADFDPDKWQVDHLLSEILPPGPHDASAQWVDLTGDGLPGIVSTAGRMLLWRNRGDGRLEGPSELVEVPAPVTLSRPNVAFADLSGDGRVDLFTADQPLQIAYAGDGRGGFLPDPVIFRDSPSLGLASPDTRLADMNGDGVTDLLQTGTSFFLTFRHVPGKGWQEPEAVSRIADLDVFPDVAFADRGVKLADMTGDGLADMLFLRGGQAWYWPNLGTGQWGARVDMAAPPQFPPGYREDRILITDIDGDGCTDVLYLDVDRTLIWLNRSGAGFEPPLEIPVVPAPQAHVLVLDLFGDGRSGLVWGGPAVVDQDSGYRALRLDPGVNPYLLKSVRNGMGRLLTMGYSTSAAMRRADRDNDADWPGSVPMIVPVVTSVRDEDEVTGSVAQMDIRYHDGVYDGPRREFRGFSRVTVDLAGDATIPSSRQEYTFFQGDPDLPDLLERDRQRALAGTQLTIRSFDLGQGAPVPVFETTKNWEVAVENVAGINIFLPRLAAVENREFGIAEPDRRDRSEFSDFNVAGNPQRIVREWFADGDAPANHLREEERVTFLDDQARWLVKLPVRREQRDQSGTPLGAEIHRYDGAPFVGLPEGSATAGLLTHSVALALREVALPADYVAGIDFSSQGYTLLGAGDVRGHYAATFSVARDAKGNIIARKDPMGSVSSMTFDDDGLFPLESVDARGRKTTSVFDARACAPIRVTFSNGQSYRFEFDPLGRQTARFETDDDGHEQLIAAWIAHGEAQPCAITTFLPRHGGRTPAEFLPPADPSVFDLTVSRTYFDGSGKSALSIATAPDGPGGGARFVARGRTLRNARGAVAIECAPEFAPNLDFTPAPAAGPEAVRYRYDARGNALETTGPGPVHVRMLRDTFSVRTFEDQAAGPPPNPTRIEHFDARNRIVRIEESLGNGSLITTSYDLTSDNRISAIHDNAGVETASYTFAGPADAIRISHRDAGARTYYRDARGLMARMLADGGGLIYTYDVAARLLRIESQLPGQIARNLVREYFYDAEPGGLAANSLDGRIAMVREPSFTVHFAYDRAGHEVSQTLDVDGATLKVAREYGLQGDLNAVVYPDGRRVQLTRDRSGAIRAIPGFVTATEYDVETKLVGYTCANGVHCASPRDSISRRLTEVSAQNGGVTLKRLAYGYDAVGNITSIEDTFQGTVRFSRYSYDGLHRIASFDTRDGGPVGPAEQSGNYAINPAGDLLNINETGPVAFSYTDPLHPGRLTQVSDAAGVRALNYDGRGRVTTFEDLATINYDALDRVSSITRSDGTIIELSDDHVGHPILRRASIGGVVSRTIFAGDLYEDHGGQTVRHVYLGSVRVARETVSGAVKTAFFLTDHHGAAILETDAAGNIVSGQRYAPFGRALDAVTLDRYVDREPDFSTGLIHFGARMYSPKLGRFLSPDWYVLENPDKPMRIPQGYNLYSYALNNPFAFTDPSGRWFFLAFIVGFAVGLIYGYADGRGADGAWSLAKETALTTGIGWGLGWTIGSVLPIFGGPAAASFFGAMGGLNGLLTGTREVYDDIQFLKPEGLASLVTDSSWGILGTTLGNAVNIYNLIAAPSSYRSDLSRRQNRQVYDRGFALKSAFAFTQGNTISNLSRGKPQGGDPGDLLQHEVCTFSRTVRLVRSSSLRM